MNTFIETYQPFGNGPVLVRVIKPFVADDFEFGEVRIGGAVDAAETFTKTARVPKRYVEGGRRVDMTAATMEAFLADVALLWTDSTDYRGKEYKRRWTEQGSGFGNRNVPGFDATFADWVAFGISERVELVAKSPKVETRQLEIDATRERVRRAIEGAVPMADWVEAYNKLWQEYADYTAEKLIKYVGELVKDMRVKDDWLEENMPLEENQRIDAMHSEIAEIDEQLKALRERKAALRQSIYDKERRVLETHLTHTQDPVLKAVFDAAIESVKDERPSMRMIFD